MEDADRLIFLEVLGSVVKKYNWLCHAYCLMDNHYHALIETPDPTLSPWDAAIERSIHAELQPQAISRGPRFQGRYKSILVQKDEHLLDLCRYIVLNPVRAGMVNQPKE